MEPKFIRSSKDLVTSRDATRGGFLEQALRKTKEASPYIAQAHQFLNRLQQAQDPQSLVDFDEIRDELVAAAGFSDKATNYFSLSELKDALVQVLQRIEKEAGSDWRADILYRFLLTRGDSLGGTMRNITGALAQVKFTEAVQEALQSKAITPRVQRSPKNHDKVQKISWSKRVLLFDRTPKFIGKNIDVILLRQLPITPHNSQQLSRKKSYIACGEIKGGIDPAGADEHWKTASGALARIRERFLEGAPKLFFVAAAIEESMAAEIFSQLQSGLLTHAANLTVPEELSDLASWLVSL